MPILTLRKTTHSIHPWRIGLAHADGRWQAIAHLTFPRKRDAAPTLAALEALDLSWSYLRDIARERLGLADLARWEGRGAAPVPAVAWDDLPLFGASVEDHP